MTGNSDSRRLLPNLKRDAGRAGAWRISPLPGSEAVLAEGHGTFLDGILRCGFF